MATGDRPAASVARSMIAPVMSTFLSRPAQHRTPCIGTLTAARAHAYFSKLTNTPIDKATSVATASTVTKLPTGAPLLAARTAPLVVRGRIDTRQALNGRPGASLRRWLSST